MYARKNKSILLLLIVMLFFSNNLTLHAAEKKEEQKTTIFLVPHQDDELLTFGVAILSHLWSNHDVHLVLMTDGRASRARQAINNKLGNEIQLQQFVDARNNEFIRSAQILGVDKDNLHFVNYKDGEITPTDVKKTISEFQEKYPNAAFKSISYLDKNNSHAAIGEGLQQMYDEGVVKDARFYLTFYQFGIDPLPETGFDEFQPHFQPLIEASADVYCRWQPEFEWYAVGKHSVPRLIEEVKENPVSRWHLPGYEREPNNQD